MNFRHYLFIFLIVTPLSQDILALDSKAWIEQLEANSVELKQIRDSMSLTTTGLLLNLSQFNPQWNLNLNSFPSYSWNKMGYSFTYGANGNITLPLANGTSFSMGLSDQMNVNWNDDSWSPTQSLSFNSSLSFPLVISNGQVTIPPNWTEKNSLMNFSLAETVFDNSRNQLLVRAVKLMLDYSLAILQAEFQKKRDTWQSEKTNLLKVLLEQGKITWKEYFDQVQISRATQRESFDATTNLKNLEWQYMNLLGLTSPDDWVTLDLPPPKEDQIWPEEGLSAIGQSKEDQLKLSIANLSLERSKDVNLGNFSIAFSATPNYKDPFGSKTFQESWGELLGPEAIWRFSLQGSFSFSGILGPKNELTMRQSYANYRNIFNLYVQNKKHRTLQRSHLMEQQYQYFKSIENWEKTVASALSFQQDVEDAVLLGQLPQSSKNDSLIDLEYSKIERLYSLCLYWKNYFDLVLLTKPNDLEPEIRKFVETLN